MKDQFQAERNALNCTRGAQKSLAASKKEPELILHLSLFSHLWGCNSQKVYFFLHQIKKEMGSLQRSSYPINRSISYEAHMSLRREKTSVKKTDLDDACFFPESSYLFFFFFHGNATMTGILFSSLESNAFLSLSPGPDDPCLASAVR